MSIKSLEDRVGKLEQQSGIEPRIVFLVYHDGLDNAKNLEIFTPEEEAVLEKYKEEMVAAAKPGERPVVVYWTKQKAQELLAQAGNDEQRDN
jgi:hypothetical protein